jgi:hypothetical protein
MFSSQRSELREGQYERKPETKAGEATLKVPNHHDDAHDYCREQHGITADHARYQQRRF